MKLKYIQTKSYFKIGFNSTDIKISHIILWYNYQCTDPHFKPQQKMYSSI